MLSFPSSPTAGQEHATGGKTWVWDGARWAPKKETLDFAESIHAAPAKPTPADADEIGYVDSAAGWGMVKLTWANIKAALSNIFLPKTGGRVADSDIKPGGIEIGVYGSGDRPAYIDLHAYGAPAEVDYAARIIRSAGASSPLIITQTGPGPVVFSASGGVLSNVGPLGYGPGAGGTVTQATSKSTAVTLNKPSGRITMNNAALNAGGSVIFIFTNSTIAIIDEVSVTMVSGANYRLEVIDIFNGGCTFRLTNISASSLSDALVFNFKVFKVALS